jgi:Rps23 Pro-64 3,4-dihydroxylase Tpa1-like proline 4-hydroxylase
MLCITQSALTTAECDTIIETCRPCAKLLNDPSYSVYSRYDFIDKNSKLKDIDCLQGYTLGTRWFYTAYDVGGFINMHQDGHTTVSHKQSKYTVLFYLNDNYEGGELVVPTMNLTVRPPKGSVVIMDQETYHYVNKITSGQKHVLRVDAI